MQQENSQRVSTFPSMIEERCSVRQERTLNWYAVKCKPHQERVARLNLERYGIVTFFPEIKENKIIRRRRKICVSALFPGYLFAKFDVDRDSRVVMYSRGVQRVVSFGPTPAAVDEALIQAIRDKLQNGYVTIPGPSFAPGQIVRIQQGPLRGMEAVFEREVPGYQRAVLLLRTLSYQAKLLVDLHAIANL